MQSSIEALPATGRPEEHEMAANPQLPPIATATSTALPDGGTLPTRRLVANPGVIRQDTRPLNVTVPVFTERSKQGKPDAMLKFGAVTSTLPMEEPSMFQKIRYALDPRNLYRMLGSLCSVNPQKVEQTLEALHLQVIQATQVPIPGPASNLLPNMTANNPITRFWTDTSIAATVPRPSPAICRELETLDSQQIAHPSANPALNKLGLSFSFQAANIPAANEKQVLEFLQKPDMVNLIVQQIQTPAPASGSAATAPSTAARALNVLRHAAASSQFPEMMGLLDQTHPRLEAFQHLLQADAQAHAPLTGGAVNEAGSTSHTFARQVVEANALRVLGTTPLSGPQKADAFAWQNGLRDNGPASDHATVKNWLAKMVPEYAQNDVSVRSPLRAARAGLGGADLRTLKEEGNDLVPLVKSPAVNTLVASLRTNIAGQINHGNDLPLDSRAKLLAQLVALDTWSPERHANLEVNDIVNGREFNLSGNTVQSRDLDTYAKFAITGQAIPTDGAIANTPAPNLTPAQVTAHRELLDMAKSQLKDVRMNLSCIDTLSRDLPEDVKTRNAAQVDGTGPTLAEVFAKAHRVINGDTAQPIDGSAKGAIDMIETFFRSAQFGNNVRLATSYLMGVNTRGFAYNIADSVYQDAETAAHHPVLIRGNLMAERNVSNVMRYGVATHGGEMSFGQEVRYTGGGGAGAQAGRNFGPDDHTSLGRVAGGGDVDAYLYDHTELNGIMFRSMREVGEVDLAQQPPRFAHRDKAVRDEMADLQVTLRQCARDLMERDRNAVPGERVDLGQAMLERIAETGLDSGLSLGLTKQVTTAHRSAVTGAASGSVTTAQDHGARFALGANVSAQRVWNMKFTQTDTTGAVRVINHREGSYMRAQAGASLSVNAFDHSAGVPPSDLASHSLQLDEVGALAKVRFVYHKDKLVPRFCFSDAEFPDVKSYENYLKFHGDEYSEMFGHAHGDDPVAGRQDLNDHIKLVNGIREPNHVYYARARLMEQHATRLNEYSGLAPLVPTQMQAFGAELQGKQRELVADEEALQIVSGIAYAPQLYQNGVGQILGGIRVKASNDMYAEREIVFDTIGWAPLKTRENAAPFTIDASGRRNNRLS